ncbi:MAG TPA: PQQ-binding-like beta-propeller repeat protein [Fimbriiglobus sp.]|jgi:outer membrane protein assembly factor BamB
MKTLCLILVLSGITVLTGADWARFRGPNGSGTADATGIPLKWTVKKNALWNVEVPGSGNGSPIVYGGKVFLQASSDDATTRLLLCYDAKTGNLDWSESVPGHNAAQKGGIHKKNTLASSTPACDGERVYCIFWDGTNISLHAYSLTGKPVWHKALGEFKCEHGAGSSPMVFAGKVYVNYDQNGAAEIDAFDAKSGDLAWRKKRKPFRACFSTPYIRELPDGRPELVVDSTAGLTGYDPATGDENWTWDWKFPVKPLRTVGGPIPVGDVVVAISGDGDGSRSAVGVSAGPNPKLLWEKTKKSPYVPMPVAKGDYLYWVHDAGLVSCVEAKTGREPWSDERINVKSISASLILTGDRITAISEEGKVNVFRATPKEFEPLWETSLGETVFATPAVADGKMFIRTARHLICIGTK